MQIGLMVRSSANTGNTWALARYSCRVRGGGPQRCWQVTDGPTAVDATVGRFRHLSAEQLFEQMPKLQTHLAGLLDSQVVASCL